MKNESSRFPARAWLVLLLLALAAVGAGLALAGDEQKGVKSRAWLGVALDEREDGVFLTSIVSESPAEEAGLAAGERVVSAEGESIEKVGDLIRALRARQPGDLLALELEAPGGARRVVEVKLGERREERVFVFSGEGLDPERRVEIEKRVRESIEKMKKIDPEAWVGRFEGSATRTWLGVELISPSDALRRHLGAEAGEGILVDDVVEESPAAEAGIEAGDLITSLDGERVDSVRTLRRLLDERKAGELANVEVLREGARMALGVTLGEREGGTLFGPRFAPKPPRAPKAPGAPGAPKPPGAPQAWGYVFGDVEAYGLELEALSEGIEQALEGLEDALAELHDAESLEAMRRALEEAEARGDFERLRELEGQKSLEQLEQLRDELQREYEETLQALGRQSAGPLERPLFPRALTAPERPFLRRAALALDRPLFPRAARALDRPFPPRALGPFEPSCSCAEGEQTGEEGLVDASPRLGAPIVAL